MNLMDKLVMDYLFGVAFGSVGSAQTLPHRQNIGTPRNEGRGSKG
jgi:hypothetical protein